MKQTNTKHRMPFNIVFKKEMKAIFRDKRMMISLLAPIVLIPVLMGIVGIVVFSFLSQTTTIATNDLQNPLIVEMQQVEGTHFDFIPLVDATEQIQSGAVIAAVIFPLDFQEKLDNYTTTEIQIITESSNQASMSFSDTFLELVTANNETMLNKVLEQAQISPTVTNLIHIKDSTLSTDGEVKDSSFFDGIFSQLSGILPMIIILGSVSGVFSIATDLGAGEKEKNSFETLLTTKANREQIIAGKLLTTVCFGLISFIAFMSTFLVIGVIAAFMFPNIVLGLFSTKLIMPSFLVIIILLLTTCFISCLALIISMWAKTYKESQAYLSYMSFAFILPTYFTMFSDIRNIPTWQLHTPLFNHIVILKQIMSGIYNWGNIIIVIIWSLIYIALTIWGLRHLLSKEKFLFNI